MGDIDGLYIQGEYQYEGLTMGKNFPSVHLDKVKDFQFREEDILVPGYLKAGKLPLNIDCYGNRRRLSLCACAGFSN